MPFKKPAGGEPPEWKRAIDRRLSSLRAIGEFPFRVVKRQFNFRKVRYLGLFKNSQTLTPRFALASLYRVRRRLLALTGSVCPWADVNGFGRSEKPPESPFGVTSEAVFSEPFVGTCKKSSGWLVGWKNAIHQRFPRHVAPPRRFERPTYRLGGGCSIRLSYGGRGRHTNILCQVSYALLFWQVEVSRPWISPVACRNCIQVSRVRMGWSGAASIWPYDPPDRQPL